MELRVLRYFLAVAREETISGSGKVSAFVAAVPVKTAYGFGKGTGQGAVYKRKPPNNPY